MTNTFLIGLSTFSLVPSTRSSHIPYCNQNELLKFCVRIDSSTRPWNKDLGLGKLSGRWPPEAQVKEWGKETANGNEPWVDDYKGQPVGTSEQPNGAHLRITEHIWSRECPSEGWESQHLLIVTPVDIKYQPFPSLSMGVVSFRITDGSCQVEIREMRMWQLGNCQHDWVRVRLRVHSTTGELFKWEFGGSGLSWLHPKVPIPCLSVLSLYY